MIDFAVFATISLSLTCVCIFRVKTEKYRTVTRKTIIDFMHTELEQAPSFAEKASVLQHIEAPKFNLAPSYMNDDTIIKFQGQQYFDRWVQHVLKLQFMEITQSKERALKIIASRRSTIDAIDSICDNPTFLAVDLEHHSYHSFHGYVCLLQLSTETQDFIFDCCVPEVRDSLTVPEEFWNLLIERCAQGQTDYDLQSLLLIDSEKLQKHLAACKLAVLLWSETLLKVFHGGSHDIAWLECNFGLRVRHLLDTFEIATVAQKCGNRITKKCCRWSSLSLAALLSSECSIHVDKSFQQADWRSRPLPLKMLQYARDDTAYLAQLSQSLLRRLESCPRYVWTHELFQKCCSTAQHRYNKSKREISPKEITAMQIASKFISTSLHIPFGYKIFQVLLYTSQHEAAEVANVSSVDCSKGSEEPTSSAEIRELCDQLEINAHSESPKSPIQLSPSDIARVHLPQSSFARLTFAIGAVQRCRHTLAKCADESPFAIMKDDEIFYLCACLSVEILRENRCWRSLQTHMEHAGTSAPTHVSLRGFAHIEEFCTIVTSALVETEHMIRRNSNESICLAKRSHFSKCLVMLLHASKSEESQYGCSWLMRLSCTAAVAFSSPRQSCMEFIAKAHAKSSKRSPQGAHILQSTRVPKYPQRKTPLYTNNELLGPDGRILARIDAKKARWYKEKKLVRILSGDDDVIQRLQLIHTPKGQGHADDGFHLAEKFNECVICGADSSHGLTRFFIVPRIYRQHFPREAKCYTSHDVVLACATCHQRADIATTAFQKQVAAEYGIPISGCVRLESDGIHDNIPGNTIAYSMHFERTKTPVNKLSGRRREKASAHVGVQLQKDAAVALTDANIQLRRTSETQFPLIFSRERGVVRLCTTNEYPKRSRFHALKPIDYAMAKRAATALQKAHHNLPQERRHSLLQTVESFMDLVQAALGITIENGKPDSAMIRVPANLDDWAPCSNWTQCPETRDLWIRCIVKCPNVKRFLRDIFMRSISLNDTIVHTTTTRLQTEVDNASQDKIAPLSHDPRQFELHHQTFAHGFCVVFQLITDFEIKDDMKLHGENLQIWKHLCSSEYSASILKQNSRTAIKKFVYRWRKNFVEALKPAFLPRKWSIDYNVFIDSCKKN